LLFLLLDLVAASCIRSSSLNSSAVSSSIGLDGLGKGATSGIWLVPLLTRPLRISFSPAIAALLRHQFFVGSGVRHNFLKLRQALPDRLRWLRGGERAFPLDKY
jgi:hypothetical protein